MLEESDFEGDMDDENVYGEDYEDFKYAYEIPKYHVDSKVIINIDSIWLLTLWNNQYEFLISID